MSGGMDSAACAFHLRAQGLVVEGLFVDHGQAAAIQEARAVSAIAAQLDIPLRKISVGGMHATGVGELTGRNAFLIFTALLATQAKPGLLGLGLHAGTPYYDCSETFVAAIGRMVAEHTDGKVSVIVPFLTWAKKDVHDYFVSTGLSLSLTYSCEAGTDPVCGRCASCNDRKALRC